MNADLAALHKILKDETRRQILLLLNDKAMTYTELMGAAEVISTGILNYHLKVLGDLVTKNELFDRF
jgi:DNA-binding transcriptional ArsR family regulator